MFLKLASQAFINAMKPNYASNYGEYFKQQREIQNDLINRSNYEATTQGDVHGELFAYAYIGGKPLNVQCIPWDDRVSICA